jgi:hypothetical protein
MKNLFNLIAIILTMFLFGCNAEPAPTPAPAPKVNSSEPTCSNSMDKEQFLVTKYGKARHVPNDNQDNYLVKVDSVKIYYISYHSDKCTDYSFLEVLQ